jgi:hypothetical protein
VSGGSLLVIMPARGSLIYLASIENRAVSKNQGSTSAVWCNQVNLPAADARSTAANTLRQFRVRFASLPLGGKPQVPAVLATVVTDSKPRDPTPSPANYSPDGQTGAYRWHSSGVRPRVSRLSARAISSFVSRGNRRNTKLPRLESR